MKQTLPLLALLCLFITPSKTQTWIAQGNGLFPAGYAIYSMSVPNDSVVWLAASNHTVVENGSAVPSGHLTKVARTTDGGETWQVHDVTVAQGRISFDIEALDANTALITGQDYGSGAGRALFKTEDGGVTWTQITACRGCGVYAELFDDQHIFAQGNPYLTWSTDGGQNWLTDTLTQYQSGEFNVVVSGNNMSCHVGDTVWVGTTNGRIVRTTQYGATSEFFNTGFPYIQCVTFKDHLQGMLFWYASASNFGLARTFDGGATWEATPTKPLTSKEYNVTYVPGTPGTYITTTNQYGLGSEVFWTTDFGETWEAGGENEGALTNCIDFHSPTAGWVATGGPITSANTPSVYKWNGDLTPPSATRESLLENVAIQAFPSPFSEALTVQVDFTDSYGMTSGSLEVLDFAGRQVFFQNIDNQPIWSKNIAAQGWANGAYLLKVRTAEGIAIRKILKQ